MRMSHVKRMLGRGTTYYGSAQRVPAHNCHWHNEEIPVLKYSDNRNSAVPGVVAEEVINRKEGPLDNNPA